LRRTVEDSEGANGSALALVFLYFDLSKLVRVFD